jgi:hypothetical protein
MHFPHYKRMFAYNTLHTEDYDKFELDVFDRADRRRSREERFPKDCAKAYDMGASLVRG